MPQSVHEQLALERAAARRARLSAEREQHELASLLCTQASLRLDLALIRLSHALGLKYRPDQPRIPAGEPGAGRWTDGGGLGRISLRDPESRPTESSNDEARIVVAGGIKPEDHGLNVEQFISRYCLGSVRQQIPGQFRNATVGEVLAAKRAGDRAADTCYKLLNDNRFRK